MSNQARDRFNELCAIDNAEGLNRSEASEYDYLRKRHLATQKEQSEARIARANYLWALEHFKIAGHENNDQ